MLTPQDLSYNASSLNGQIKFFLKRCTNLGIRHPQHGLLFTPGRKVGLQEQLEICMDNSCQDQMRNEALVIIGHNLQDNKSTSDDQFVGMLSSQEFSGLTD